jgi:Fe-S cluster assembly protein SufD
MPLITPTQPGAARLGHTHAADVPEQSRGERRRSFDPTDLPPPTGREEEWRFTPLDRLADLLAEPAGQGRLQWLAELPEGATVTDITGAQARELGIMTPADRPAALAFASGGARRLDVAAGAELTAPARVGLSGDQGETAFGHLVITAGRHSTAVVVLDHRGSARHSELVSVIAADGAHLTVVSIQEWDEDSVHLAEHDLQVGRDANVRHIAVTLGGAIVRMSVNVRYAGPGGRAEALGVYFADAGQHLEHRLFIDHEPPHCSSRVTYKGALQGDSAHTVWVGDVLIGAGAEGTDTYELNRNLLLTGGARADSIPNLEIETGRIVGAGHASATGRFDDEQLFYAQARGIPPKEARRLIVMGFFADVLHRIEVPEIVLRLTAAIEAELSLTEAPLAESERGR